MSPDEVERLVALEQASAFHPWSRHSIEQALSDPNTRVWLTACAYCIERRVLDEAEIHTIGVHPTHRRQGHARRLLTRIQQEWANQGIARAFLEVREGNQRARGLYRALGWQENGRRADYYGPGEHAICMDWSTP